MTRLLFATIMTTAVVAGQDLDVRWNPWCPQPGVSKDKVYGIKSGFWTGNEYRDLSQAEQTAYLIGVFDGLLMSNMLNAPLDCVQSFSDKNNGIHSDQLHAMMDKYLSEHPEKWQFPMTALVSNMFRDANFPEE